ncbi:MAG: hypothetical protein FD123_3229 [Bacteroidetes bacterium]|nr:MAG: hypothetical protein FD123_3229 [Bacteroidota bacterium]
MAKEALTSKYSIVYGDDGILRVKPKADVIVDLEDAIIYFEACERLTEGKRVPVLLDSTDDYTVSRKAQQYSSEKSKTRLATAVVSSSSFIQFTINLYVSVFKPATPIRMFSNEEEAIAWLKQFM